MKLLIYSLLNMICITIGYSQSEFIKISNSLSKNHINIPPTKISIVPPLGYSSLKNSFGFKNDRCLILVQEYTDKDYIKELKRIGKEKYLKQGIIVNSIEELEINNLKGHILRLENDIGGSTQLLFGNSTYYVHITGLYPSNSSLDSIEIEKSIESAFYDSTRNSDPFEIANFEIDLSSTTLLFSEFKGTTFHYKSISAKTDREETVLYISQMETDSNIINNTREIARKSYDNRKLKLTELEIIDEGSIFHDKIIGYYYLYKTRTIDKEVCFYTTIVSKGEKSFFIEVISFTGMNENMINAISAIKQITIK